MEHQGEDKEVGDKRHEGGPQARNGVGVKVRRNRGHGTTQGGNQGEITRFRQGHSQRGNQIGSLRLGQVPPQNQSGKMAERQNYRRGVKGKKGKKYSGFKNSTGG